MQSLRQDPWRGSGRYRRAPALSLPLALPLTLALLPACILPSPSYDEYSSDSASVASSPSQSSDSSGSGGSATSATATTSSTGDPTSGPGSTSTGSPTTASTTSTSEETSGETSGGDDVYLVNSCADLQSYLMEAGDPVLSGVYTILSPSKRAPVEVYCDLETAGGGWLLVGRSVPMNDDNSFGWTSGTGDLDDDAKPYSVNVKANGFAFEEVLIGTWSDGKAWGDHIYRYGVPGDLLSHGGDLVPTTFLENVYGDCKPGAGPKMLTYVGATDKTSAFFFRDTDTIDEADYGLLHDMVWTYHLEPPEDCLGGGMLAQKQGMLMIR